MSSALQKPEFYLTRQSTGRSAAPLHLDGNHQSRCEAHPCLQSKLFPITGCELANCQYKQAATAQW